MMDRVLRCMVEVVYRIILSNNFYNMEGEQPSCFQTNVVCARFGNRKTIFEMKQFAVREGDNIVFNPSSPLLVLRIPP